MGGFVHRDEVRKDGSPVRDHMHVPFTPILDGRFNFKKMCPRTFYQSLHKDLGDYLEQHLGYRPEIELGDETRALRVYTDKSADIDKVRGAVDRAVVQPAEEEAARIVADAQARASARARCRDAQGRAGGSGRRWRAQALGRADAGRRGDRQIGVPSAKSGRGCARRCGTGTHRCRCSQVRGCGTR